MRIPHAVRAEILRHFGEQQLELGRGTGTTHAAGRGDVHRRARRDQPGLRQRGQRHQNAGCITPGVGHHACAVQRRPKELGQAIRRVVRHARRRMIGSTVTGAQIARQVHHPRTGRNHFRHPLGRRTMRQRREHQIGARQIDLVGTHHRNRVNASTSPHAQRRAALRVRRGKRQREMGMAQNEGAQFAPRVSARAQHAHAVRRLGNGRCWQLRQVR